MGRYGAYPAYKASGVAWLGEIPAHWQLFPIKFALAMPITDGPHETPELLEEGIPFVSAEAIKNDQIDFGKIRGHISLEDHRRYSRKYKPQYGDIYMVKSGATTGSVARVLTHVEFNIWSPLAALRPDMTRSSTDFLFYAMKSSTFSHAVAVSWSFGTQQNIGMSVISNIRIAFPPLPEQQAIARFLDHKTAQIDALIARKEALLARLADKRTALISQAVTKGLDPAAPMKNSGIDWLGEIPAHWEIVRFSHFIDFQEGPGIMAADFHEDGIPLLRIVNLKPGYVDLEGCNFLDPEKVKAKWQHFRVSENDLLISSSASTGLVSLVDDISAGSIPYTGIIRLRPARDDVRRTYIEVFVGSELFATQINLLKTGTTIQHYGPIHLRQMIFPLPPPNEQEQISEFVMSMSSEIDGQSATIRSAIDKLKQYRTALITHAVTGKIDVRGVALPN